MGFLSRLFGKGTPEPVVQASVPDDQEKDEHEFVDIDLLIESVEQTDGMFRITARETLEANCVGIVVTFGAEWDAQTMEDSEFIAYWGHAELSSLGAQSDGLVHHLARLYDLPLPEPKKMLAAIPVRVVGLHCDPSRMADMPVRTKAFFHSDAGDSPDFEQRYAELFVNVDLAQGVLQLHEKDPEYREPLLRALTTS